MTSKAVKVISGTGRRKRVFVQSLNRTGEQVANDNAKRRRMLAQLSYQDRAEFMNSGNGDTQMEDGWSDDEGDAFVIPPPGEEGAFHSNQGDEELIDIIVNGAQSSKLGDPRLRKTRIQRMINAWRQQMQLLTDAYLKWKKNGIQPIEDENLAYWEVETHSITERSSMKFFHSSSSSTVNETLVLNGYLGASPERPAVAFSLVLLEIFRQMHRVCPRLSVYSMTKALSFLHGCTFKHHYAEQFSCAYDCYLEILREIKRCRQKALKRDKTWEQSNICAPCMYHTKDERNLKFSMLVAMDGNNSLKLVDSSFKAGSPRDDDRSILSYRWLSPEEVDVYKDEVKRTLRPRLANAVTSQSTSAPHPLPTPASNTAQSAPENSSSSPAQDNPIDPETYAFLNATENEEEVSNPNVCVERWKSASPEARKKMFALFAKAGVFVAVCRHGHVLLVCDMIWSGELMKYPISITKALLDRYGRNIGLGYDIMCAFMKTLLNSSLKDEVVDLNLNGVVPAFHGHAHNRLCQVHWHPLYMEGPGLEDFETCERTFQKSNELASVTRLATPFHRQQEIEEHWSFIDEDKHEASANFIFQNYRQALEKIKIDGALLAKLSVELNITNADCERYIQEEQTYLKSLQREPDEVQVAVEYLALLKKLDRLHYDSMSAKTDYEMLDFNIIHNGYTRKEISKVRTRYTTTYSLWEACNTVVCEFESAHLIEERWTSGMQQYKDAELLLSERTFRRALDELERLVVQRLFEMTKLGMSGVGYRLRDKIGRSLKQRSNAIATALKKYNEAAVLLSPPKPLLTWASVMQAAAVADFDLLRDSRGQITSKAWADGPRREAMNLYFGIKRAHEEIDRLNVEIVRLLTFMRDEHIDYSLAIKRTTLEDPYLAAELSREHNHCNDVSRKLAKRLYQTSCLEGFTGRLEFGTRVGREAGPDGIDSEVPDPPWLFCLDPLVRTAAQGAEQDDADLWEDIDIVEGESEAMAQLVDSLSM